MDKQNGSNELWLPDSLTSSVRTCQPIQLTYHKDSEPNAGVV